ncbi:MAG: GNAT family N-acetyltransferase [Anaerolineae bacterium]|nr:GNAT family N-acetyltransferase [Anaerolineae bacterium]
MSTSLEALLTPLETPRGPVRVRFLTPDDGELLVDLVKRLSPESRYHRFHVPVEFRSDEELWARIPPYLAVDRENHVALVGLAQEGEREAAIAVVRFARQPGEEEAEIAVVVRDDWQRLGIGRRLVMQAVEVARTLGIKRLAAWVQPDNRQALRLAAALPFRSEHRFEGGESHIVLHIAEPAG